jgi:hypothetical protein
MLVVAVDLVKMPADLMVQAEAVVLPIVEADLLGTAAELLALLLFLTLVRKKAQVVLLHLLVETLFIHSQLVVRLQLNKGDLNWDILPKS